MSFLNYQKVNGLSFNGGATYLNLADGSRLALGQVGDEELIDVQEEGMEEATGIEKGVAESATQGGNKA